MHLAFEGSRKENEEYLKILSIVQKYAILKANDGVGFVCRRKGGKTDLNTCSIDSVNKAHAAMNQSSSPQNTPTTDTLEEDHVIQLRLSACKDVISNIYGSSLSRELLYFECGKGDLLETAAAALKIMKENERSDQDISKDTFNLICNSNSLKSDKLGEYLIMGSDYGATVASESDKKNTKGQQFTFAFEASGYITNGSYSVPRSSSRFILFVNKRLVESNAIRRSVESVYSDILPRGVKPFVYISVLLPGPHIDCNIHPTKREVALLHEDKLCDVLSQKIRELLCNAKSSRTFYAQTLLLKSDPGVSKGIKTATELTRELSRVRSQESNGSEQKRKPKDDNENNDSQSEGSMNREGEDIPCRKPKIARFNENVIPLPPKKKPAYDPRNLVRTRGITPHGALEPFLVKTRKNYTEERKENSNISSSSRVTKNDSILVVKHSPDCEFFGNGTGTIDMTKPGAFATAICRCQVQRSDSLPPLQQSNQQQPFIVPKKISPTECSYTSIETLRTNINLESHEDLTSKIREGVFVGCISRHLSLWQSGIELVMINHKHFAEELFYQLALSRFGGLECASVTTSENGLDVKALVERFLQLDESIASFKDTMSVKKQPVNQRNMIEAFQASKCLTDKAPMLNEYFSIKFAQNNEALMLTGLPILLEGHSPQPHALPLFLYRLATTVDWKDEQRCFDGICRELGAYYAEVPMKDIDVDSKDNQTELVDDSTKKYVQHTLFPALKYLLIPQRKFADNGSFTKLAVLSKLYKVFERC